MRTVVYTHTRGVVEKLEEMQALLLRRMSSLEERLTAQHDSLAAGLEERLDSFRRDNTEDALSLLHSYRLDGGGGGDGGEEGGVNSKGGNNKSSLEGNSIVPKLPLTMVKGHDNPDPSSTGAAGEAGKDKESSGRRRRGCGGRRRSSPSAGRAPDSHPPPHTHMHTAGNGPDSSGESVNRDEELVRRCVRELGAQVEWKERQRDDREHAREQRLTQHLQVTS